MGLVHDSPPAVTDEIDKKPSRSPRGFWRPTVIRIVAVCSVALLLAAAIWVMNVERGVQPGVDIEMLAPIRIAVETASRQGKMVLPGGEQSLDGSGSIYRSGYLLLTEPLESSLDYLHNLYLEGSETRDVVYWLAAGYVADMRISAARDIVSKARERYAEDLRIATLEAIIAYYDGDHDRSLHLLDRILSEFPDDPVASINLAVVLDELGGDGEARDILTDVIERHSGSPLARRAQSILTNIQKR